MFIDQQLLLDATDGGLQIILMYYPDAEGAVQDPRKKFRVRKQEKTPSASLKKLKDGNYVVTDFGGDASPRNGIQVCMHEECLEYREAIQFLAAHFNIGGQAEKPQAFQKGYEKKPAEADQKSGDYFWETKDFTEKELALLGPDVTARICQHFHLYSLASYTYVSKDKKTGELVQHVFTSNEHYPVFQFILGDGEKQWGKRLEPMAFNKADRFRYFGTRPKDFLMGLAYAKKAYEDENMGDEDDYEQMEEAEQKESRKTKKLPLIIICGGDRDALATYAATGYHVVWMNSETAELSYRQFKELERLAYKVAYLGDIDSTGLREAHKICMKHLDLYKVMLPSELMQRRDHRGHPCKDVRDFLQHYNKFKLRELIDVAIPYRMWDEKWQKDTRTDRYVKRYEVNNLQLYNFLQAAGFHRFTLPNVKTGYIYVRRVNNVVEEVDAVEVKAYVNDFLRERNALPELRNAFYRARNHLGEQSLSNLDKVDIDFTDFTAKSQLLFFQNTVWEVSKDAIAEHKLGDVNRYVWHDEVIPHRVKVLDPPFSVSYNEKADDHKIEIHNRECLFLQYLINTSRVHWREEQRLAKEGKELPKDMRHEQDLHLINKLYSLGYLLHRYKDPNRPWAVFAMDNKISDDGESHGGSGKSIAYKAIRYFMKYVTLEGRNPKLTDNPHIWENVNSHTDYVLVDDANQYLKIDYFYSMLTGELTVNPKHGRQYEIPFEEVPKIAITSNFGLRNTDPSTERRLLYTVFSDYYHHNKDGEYERSWTPADEFGKNLFQDFDENEWNLFFNTMATCMKVYLSFSKIDPPMENVKKRNLITQMTQPFKDWADVYFDEKDGSLDAFVIRKVAFDNFLEHNPGQRRYFNTTNRFTKSLRLWCDYYGYSFNPKEAQNSDGRIIRKVDGKAEEHFYIKAYKTKIEKDEQQDSPDAPFGSPEEEDTSAF